MSDNHAAARAQQTLAGAAVLVIGALLAWGAAGISAEAGYAGVGPNFLPWVMAVALMLCGLMLIVQARRGGFRDMEPPSGAERGDWRAFAWVAAGIVANAALITGFTVPGLGWQVPQFGFVPSCTLCYVLAVRGLRASEGRFGGGARQLLLDAVTGFLIAAPAYWLFTKLLSINLPGLTASGWL